MYPEAGYSLDGRATALPRKMGGFLKLLKVPVLSVHVDGAFLRTPLYNELKNRKVLVSVYNEGQGISEADLPLVFERFYKSDKSRGLNKSGVGLGLFISKTIVEAHQEKIWVESEAGKDCCFNFTLAGE